MRRRMRALLLTTVVAVVAGALTVVSWPAQAASGTSLDGTSPSTTGCTKTAWVAGEDQISPEYGQTGEGPIGTLQLFYSSGCHTAWVKLYYPGGCPSTTQTGLAGKGCGWARVTRDDDGKSYQCNLVVGSTGCTSKQVYAGPGRSAFGSAMERWWRYGENSTSPTYMGDLYGFVPSVQGY